MKKILSVLIIGLMSIILVAQEGSNIRLKGVEDEISNILWLASLAPNSHNTQAWKVYINTTEKEIEVTVDKERALSVVDPNSRELYISLGCYIETMCFAFDASGYKTNVSEKYVDNYLQIKILYTKVSDTINNEKLGLIEKRHTNKGKYLSTKLNSSVLSNVKNNNPDFLYFENTSVEFEYIKDATYKAIELQSKDQAYRDELANWMRFSDEEALEKKDGITAEMIGLRGLVKSIYYSTTNHESAKEDKFANQGNTTAKNQLNNCTAFFVITGNNTPEDLVKVGRTTQSIWLECTKNNIALQPMSALLEISEYSKETQVKLNSKAPVQMILRAGNVKKYGENFKLCRNLVDYITVKK